MAYREYPRHVHKPDGRHLVVRTDAERDAALQDGWSLSAVFDGPLARGGEPSPPVDDVEVAAALGKGRRKAPARTE